MWCMRKTKNLVFPLLFIFVSFFFVACKKESTIEPRVRILVNGNYMNDAEIKVVVESETGMSVTGAFVYMQDSTNEILVLEYDTTKKQYYGTFPVSKNDSFFVYVDSILFSKPKKYKIKIACLSEKPVITSFTDETGSSVLLGESLKRSVSFRLSWNNVCDDAVYRISFKKAVETVYSISTENNTLLVPAFVFEPGDYYVCIKCQKTLGDLFYKTSDYYSSFCVSSNNLSFSVE